jgi:SAM-dependent methyltransferase
VYRRVVLMERLLGEPIAELTARFPVAIDLLKETEVDEYTSFRPDADPLEICRRLEAGQWCFVARHEGRIVHACWAATGRAWIDYLGCAITLAPDEVYQYDSFTAPDVRGRNLAAVRVIVAARYFRQANYRRLVAVVVPENTLAFRPLEKAGYRPFGVMGYVKISRWRWNFCRVNRNAFPPGVPPPAGPAYWDDVVQRLADRPHYLDVFLGQLKRQAYLGLIQRWGGAPATGRILKTDLFEEAIGPDAFLADLCHGGAVVIGMDVSTAISSQAQGRDADRQAHYVAADVRRLPFASDAFALIVSPSTLDHFPDSCELGRSLRELARVLEPGGRLIIMLDNSQNIFAPLLRLIIRMGWVPYYIGRSYSVGELCNELEAAGLTAQETTAILHNPHLMAVAAVAVTKKLHWPPLTALVQRALLAAQRLEKTQWRYRTGSFVAAKAVRRGSGFASGIRSDGRQVPDVP